MASWRASTALAPANAMRWRRCSPTTTRRLPPNRLCGRAMAVLCAAPPWLLSTPGRRRRWSLREPDGGIEIEASHDGYVQPLGLIHTRTLKLDAGGARLGGVDKLTAAKGIVRFAWDVPLAIHFHLHPDAEARLGRSPDTAELLL